MRRIASPLAAMLVFALAAPLATAIPAGAADQAGTEQVCTRGHVQSLAVGTIPVAKQSFRDSTSSGSSLSWSSCQFRLYDDNDNEDSPDAPEVPHVFKSSDWFLGGLFGSVDMLEHDRDGANAILDSIEHHLYWRAQGSEWVELPLVETSTRSAFLDGILPMLRHWYHVFPAGSLTPGVYEWRYEQSGAPEEWGDDNGHGEIHIVP